MKRVSHSAQPLSSAHVGRPAQAARSAQAGRRAQTTVRPAKTASLSRALLLVLVSALTGVLLLFTGCKGGVEGAGLSLGEAKVVPPTVAASGILRVGVDSSHAPFAGIANGSLIGIDIDIAAALADDLGLKLEIVDIVGQDASALLADGSIDIVMGIQQDDPAAPVAAQVGPYLVDAPAVFALDFAGAAGDFDLGGLNGVKVAAQEGSLSAWQIGELYGEDWVSNYPSLNAAFDALESGEVSYAAADAVVGSFLAVKYPNIDCAALLTDPTGIYMGVAVSNLELLDTLQTSLRTIRDNGVLEVIIDKWLGPISAQVVSNHQAIVSLESGVEEADLGEDLPDPSNAGD
ncbi:MAG: transporter substrate-binding domain-containing protein [Coriobacteriales bacterium]|jgi:polar amino acid transport system substrate-binding protein|nr:transporter substrate-binding domain-containing protein [Coriobacteriales bacterium]